MSRGLRQGLQRLPGCGPLHLGAAQGTSGVCREERLLLGKEYVDEAESGRSVDRPGFKAMITAAGQQSVPFNVIQVWKLSRFALNREDSIIYKSLLRKHAVQLISINEPLEDTPLGRLLEGIIEVIDEFYSANLSQDVVRGMRENASRGFYNGGAIPIRIGHNNERCVADSGFLRFPGSSLVQAARYIGTARDGREHIPGVCQLQEWHRENKVASITL